MLILAVLRREATHGYAIARAIERDSGDLLAIEEGSLYPALARLERAGHIDSSWAKTHTGRRGKVFYLTTIGRDHYDTQRRLWHEFVGAVARVLVGTPARTPFDIESIGD